MDKRKLELSPSDEVIPGTPEVLIKKQKPTLKKLAGNCKNGKVVENIENKPDNFDLAEELKGLDDFEFDDTDFGENLSCLDLSSLKRCKVNSVETDKKTHNLILKLQDEATGETGICQLTVPWCYSKIESGQIVSCEGVWDEKLNSYKITSESGRIIVNPDCLISGTSVVGSLFCQRKGILSEKFRGIDSDSKIMNIGSLIHEVLQSALRKKAKTLEEITQVSDEILKSPSTIHMLYSCRMSEEEIRKEVNQFLPKLHQFIKRYVLGDYNIPMLSKNPSYQPYSGQIDEIQDIEENIWSPRLGLKGKIDVTVKVRERNKYFDANVKVMPLELKTGEARFSLEHKGQVILYQMMMTDMGKKVDSGLLLYLRELVMSEILGSRPEKRDLIMLRNELAHFMSKDFLEKNQEYLPNLPDPISHHSACGKCPYNILCCTFLKFQKNVEISPNNPLNEIGPVLLAHLKPEHFDYFLHWTHLIVLENKEAQKQNQLKLLWTKSPEERSKRGSALINLEIFGEVINLDEEEFLHTFESPVKTDFVLSSFEVGDYLIVSTNKRVSVAAGRVVDLTAEKITMSLERNLKTIFPNQVFHLDKYETQSGMVFNLTNLGVLLDPLERSERLRKIIIEKIPPTFIKSLPGVVARQGETILKQLNPVQRRAVLQALTTTDYMLLKGLPGTGKTQTLIALIQLLIILKRKILITSHTHSAVDNILLRLHDRKIKFMRLGSISRIHPSLREYSEHSLTSKCQTPEELEKVYGEQRIIGVTCLGSAHPLIAQTTFDICLVDEATQILQCSIIRPLLSSTKFILVGDPEQLPPLVRSNEAKDLGADESLFKRLDCEAATRVLNLQYRMNKVITKLANSLTYQGELKCANEAVENATLQIPRAKELYSKYSSEKWMIRALSPHLEQSCTLLNTENVFEIVENFGKFVKNGEIKEEQEKPERKTIYQNYCEVALVLHLIGALIEFGIKGQEIGVIAPYRAQVETLKCYVNRWKRKTPKMEEMSEVEVNTVDQYQGRDKNIIIYSCTHGKSKESSEELKKPTGEILEDRRRLTVAITRSKQKLIMIGDVEALNKYSPFQDLFRSMNSLSKIQLQDGKQGFSWNTLLDELKAL